MQTSTHGIRDGILFLVGLLVLIVGILSLTNVAQNQDMYRFKIRFNKAQSLPEGAVVQVSGVPVGQVETVALQPSTNQSLVSVRVSNSVKLYRDDLYTIGTGGLVGEKYIDITPTHTGGRPIGPGAIVQGVSAPQVDDLVSSTNELLGKLNQTATGLNNLIGSHEDQEAMKRAVRDFERAASTSVEIADSLNSQFSAHRGDLAATITDLRNTTRSSAEFAAALTRLLQDNQGEINATVAGMRQTSESTAALVAGLNEMVQRNAGAIETLVSDLGAVTKDLRQVSASLSPQLSGTKMIQNMEAATTHMAAIAARMEQTATAVDSLVNDPELVATLRDSAKNLRQAGADLTAMTGDARKAVAALPGMTADLQSITTNVKDTTVIAKDATVNVKDATASMKTASSDLPGLTKPFKEIAPEAAENLLGITRTVRRTTTTIDETATKLTSIGSVMGRIRLQPDGRVLGLIDAPRDARADANLNVGSRSVLRAGVADIGNTNGLNAQLGRRVRPNLLLRAGMVQSHAGAGMDYAPFRNLQVSGEVFAPRDPRVNLQADYRLFDDWWLSAGWYDAFDARRAAGAGLTYRPAPKEIVAPKK
jgi:virulence factor Mce-like protein